MATDVDRKVQQEIAKAQHEFRGGSLDRASERVERLYAEHPRRHDVRVARAMVLGALGRAEEALEGLQEALAERPDDAESLAWAAYHALNLRRFEDAERSARRLTQIAPRNARGFYLLANALRAQDQIRPALEAIDAALRLQPDDPECLLTKARILRAWRMPGLAVPLYEKAIQKRPVPGAVHDLAKLHLQESHPEAALELLQRVERDLPPAARPHALVAEALTMLRRFEESDARWADAAKQSQDPDEYGLVRAKAEIAAGRFEVAEPILSRWIEQGRQVPDAFATLTTARKMTADHLPLLQRLESLAVTDSVSLYERSTLHYALGKSFDDLKDFERAMRHFDAANAACLELYPQRRNFDPEAMRAFNDLLIREFDGRQLVREGNPSARPLFVVGMMRSGTTLTESVLGSHSQVAPGGEQSFWTERAIEFVFQHGNELELDRDKADALASEYLRLIGNGRERYVVDKNPSNFDLAGLLHSVFPNARFLHLKRQPLDNLLSLWMTPMSGNVAYASKIENLAFAYREHLRLWEHWRKVLPPERFATFHYEDLTSHPEETITRMLGTLELPVEDACFAPENAARSVLTPSVFQVRQPIHAGSQGRWRNYENWKSRFSTFDL